MPKEAGIGAKSNAAYRKQPSWWASVPRIEAAPWTSLESESETARLEIKSMTPPMSIVVITSANARNSSLFDFGFGTGISYCSCVVGFQYSRSTNGVNNLLGMDIGDNVDVRIGQIGIVRDMGQILKTFFKKGRFNVLENIDGLEAYNCGGGEV